VRAPFAGWPAIPSCTGVSDAPLGTAKVDERPSLANGKDAAGIRPRRAHEALSVVDLCLAPGLPITQVGSGGGGSLLNRYRLQCPLKS
jgi:hypothetical protein